MLKQNSIGRSYGCLFCVTGKEFVVAERIQRDCPDVQAIVARQEKPKSVNGKKTRMEVVFLPGYVFFETPSNRESLADFPREHVIRFLTMDGGAQWRLTGTDAAFALWLFQNNGLLSFSKACKEGDQIRIVSGPLKDRMAQVQKVDKRGHSMKVQFPFQDRSVSIWLSYDLVDT